MQNSSTQEMVQILVRIGKNLLGKESLDCISSFMQRRQFLNKSLAAGGLASILAHKQAPAQQASGANEVVRLGFVGCGGRGNQVLGGFLRVEGIEVTALCDADPNRIGGLNSTLEKNGRPQAQGFQDYRELLESGLVDAIVNTTPNHLHVSITVDAMQAGLDVYVEKPVSHNIAEGRKMVEVSRETGRIVMAGTQNRADTSIHAAKQWFAENSAQMGELTGVHSFWYNIRRVIGEVKKPTPVPAHIDYDLYMGPRPLEPLMRGRLHYDWHWQWATGNGEMGNVGIHVIDQMRFFLDLESYPSKLESVGGRLIGKDDGNTPSDHLVAMDYDLGVPVTLMVTGLTKAKDATDGRRINRSGAGTLLQYENGSIQINRGGSQVFGADGQRIEHFGGDSGQRIFQNFVDCVKSRRREDQYAEIEQGHISTAVCHLANNAHRIGESGVDMDQVGRRAKMLPQSGLGWTEFSEHIAANEVDLSTTPLVLSPVLTIDAAKERCVEDEAGIIANYLATEVERAPYGVLSSS